MENTNESMRFKGEKEIIQSTGKGLWNPKGFLILSILFSFLPAAVLYSLNYGRLGLSKKRNISLVVSFVFFIVMISMVFVINQGIMKSIIYGVNIGVAIYMNNNQAKIFENHIKNGGKKASYIVPTLASIVISAVILSLAFYSINIPDQKLIFKGNELYYTDRVSKQDAENLGNYLSEQGFFNENRKTSVKIDKLSNTYKFSLIIDKNHLEDKELEQSVKDMINILSKNVFNSNKVDIVLCDDVFKPLKTISK
ncbi:MAG: hypothetical protein Q8936_15710 [Bacillota bacterium]|nr:hypothetical protein [Bacillota bacterium]